MPRIRRRFLVDPTEVGIYHCINRCVRRSFLCGKDPLSGKDYEHRRQWIQDRMQFLAGQFGTDVLGFAVMSNHLHVVLRNRPDVVQNWSDAEVALRWWNIFPMRRDDDGNAKPPTDFELLMIISDPVRLGEIRRRLSDVSWFMRCLVEPIARSANREDLCRGRFWEGRFKAVQILDESALAACLAYVDLNPIRACMADTPETSRFTSVYERIHALSAAPGDPAAARMQREPQVMEAAVGGSVPAAGRNPESLNPETRNAWLSPFELSEATANQPIPTARASNKGCLPMSFADYLKLLDWTGGQIRADKRGAIPQDLAPILERLHIGDDGWLKMIGQFSRMFRRAAGRPHSMQRERDRRGGRLIPGISHSREVFV